MIHSNTRNQFIAAALQGLMVEAVGGRHINEIAKDAILQADAVMGWLEAEPQPKIEVGQWIEVQGPPSRREQIATQALTGAMSGWFNYESGGWRPGTLTHPEEVVSDVLDHVDELMRQLRTTPPEPPAQPEPAQPEPYTASEYADRVDAERYRCLRAQTDRFIGLLYTDLDAAIDTARKPTTTSEFDDDIPF